MIIHDGIMVIHRHHDGITDMKLQPLIDSRFQRKIERFGIADIHLNLIGSDGGDAAFHQTFSGDVIPCHF